MWRQARWRRLVARELAVIVARERQAGDAKLVRTFVTAELKACQTVGATGNLAAGIARASAGGDTQVVAVVFIESIVAELERWRLQLSPRGRRARGRVIWQREAPCADREHDDARPSAGRQHPRRRHAIGQGEGEGLGRGPVGSPRLRTSTSTIQSGRL